MSEGSFSKRTFEEVKSEESPVIARCRDCGYEFLASSSGKVFGGYSEGQKGKPSK